MNDGYRGYQNENGSIILGGVIMAELNNPIKFMAHCVSKAILHPLTPIKYYYCEHCRVRFNGTECPKCGVKP